MKIKANRADHTLFLIAAPYEAEQQVIESERHIVETVHFPQEFQTVELHADNLIVRQRGQSEPGVVAINTILFILIFH